MELIDDTPTVAQQVDGEAHDDDVAPLLMQDPSAVSTNSESPKCPALPPWEEPVQQSPDIAVVQLSVKPRQPGHLKFKDCGVLINREFFINPAFQSKYEDNIQGKEMLIPSKDVGSLAPLLFNPSVCDHHACSIQGSL